ncbi:uncharacterized protein LOC136084469 [Hydra vulgaris]|uniref:Uncharacterized protein LOC136084469 n=1 Tax=Hydra vulgaris TaxID=6087 RepID=A0ABM4CFL7_HYDVU
MLENIVVCGVKERVFWTVEKLTLGSLYYHYSKYTEAGKPKSKMADYKNVINPRLLYLEEDPDTIIKNLVPVPELHTLIGIVTTFRKLLSKLWPGFKNSNYIFFRGYHGIGFDGNNANRLLDKLYVLSRGIADQGKLDLLPVIECLRKFQSMKQATFGEKIGDIESVVFEFKMSYANLREYINTYFENISLNLTWKVHTAVNHIVPFLKSTNTDNGLGIYSEQAGESVHYEFKKTWNKYKR